MGIIICKKHGRTGIMRGVLKEICQIILSDKHLDQNELSTIFIDYYDENELLFTDKYLVTTKFKKENDLKNCYKIFTEEDELLISKPIESNMSAICAKCYNEYIDRHNIIVKL